jgi:hypothetical protein
MRNGIHENPRYIKSGPIGMMRMLGLDSSIAEVAEQHTRYARREILGGRFEYRQ